VIKTFFKSELQFTCVPIFLTAYLLFLETAHGQKERFESNDLKVNTNVLEKFDTTRARQQL
jgi:hypothetical protein